MAEPTIVIVCELGELEGLTHQQAAAFEKALRAVAAEVFPERRIRGLWVHKSDTTDRLRRERSEARGLARILAHAYQTDNRPPPRVVADALAFPALEDLDGG